MEAFTKKQLSKSQKRFLILMKNVKTLLDHIKLNIKLKCVEIGSFLENVSSKINVHLLMEIKNFTKSYIFLRIIRLKYVTSFMKRCIAHMEIGVSFYILNMIQLIKIKNLTILRYFWKTLDFPQIGLIQSRKVRTCKIYI